MGFKIDWASLIVGSRFPNFALFYFLFKGNFPGISPRGGLYLEGLFNGEFFCVSGLGGLYFGGAYFRNFTVINIEDRVKGKLGHILQTNVCRSP